MNARKTKNQRTAKPKHIVALADPKGKAKDEKRDCTTAAYLPDCNSAKYPCPCHLSGCQTACKFACQSLCKFGCKPSEKEPPPPAKKSKTETKKGRASGKK